MPTDLAPSVQPVYQPVVNRPDDAEILDAAALTNLALPILDRVEFNRQQAESLNIIRYREDFSRPEIEPSGFVVFGDAGGWDYLDLGGSSNNPSTTGSGGGFGALSVLNNGSSSGVWRLIKPEPIQFGTGTRFASRCRIDTIAAGNGLEVGWVNQNNQTDLATGDGATFVGDPSLGPNFFARTDDGTTPQLTDTGIPLDTAFHAFSITREPGGIRFKMDGGAFDFLQTFDIPADSTSVFVYAGHKTPNTGVGRQFVVDLIFFDITIDRGLD